MHRCPFTIHPTSLALAHSLSIPLPHHSLLSFHHPPHIPHHTSLITPSLITSPALVHSPSTTHPTSLTTSSPHHAHMQGRVDGDACAVETIDAGERCAYVCIRKTVQPNIHTYWFVCPPPNSSSVYQRQHSFKIRSREKSFRATMCCIQATCASECPSTASTPSPASWIT